MEEFVNNRPLILIALLALSLGSCGGSPRRVPLGPSDPFGAFGSTNSGILPRVQTPQPAAPQPLPLSPPWSLPLAGTQGPAQEQTGQPAQPRQDEPSLLPAIDLTALTPRPRPRPKPQPVVSPEPEPEPQPQAQPEAQPAEETVVAKEDPKPTTPPRLYPALPRQPEPTQPEPTQPEPAQPDPVAQLTNEPPPIIPELPIEQPLQQIDPAEPAANAQLPSQQAFDPAAEYQRARLPNGMTTIAVRYLPTPERTAEVTLGMLVGTDMGKRGLADLAAFVLSNHGDATAGRPSLRQGISELGGTLFVEQGPLSTWFTAQVPADRWAEAMTIVGRAIANPAPGRSQLERLQDTLLQQETDAVLETPAAAIAARMLLGDRCSDAHLHAIQQRDATEVAAFLQQHNRPDRAVLTVRAPVESWLIGQRAFQEFSNWPGTTTPGEPLPDAREERLIGGIYWAASMPAATPPEGRLEDRCRVALVLPLPDPLQPDAAAQHLLLNCLTMDGIGGRLEKLQRDAGLQHVLWTAHFVSQGEVSATVLETEASSDEAAQLWQLANEARSSLGTLPPTESELAFGAGRAWLTLRRGQYGSGSDLRLATLSLLRGVGEAKLRQRLDDLRQPDAVPPSATLAFLEQPMAMFVIGGTPPPNLTSVRSFEVVPSGFQTTQQSTGGDALIEAALPWISRAMQSAGGESTLRRVTGFSASGTIRTEGAPTIEESIEWAPGGSLLRRRKVLGTTIETRISGNEWSEQVGSDKAKLNALEASWRLAESERHPVALLISHASGRLPFRLLSTRQQDDREYALLEAVTDRFERLRVEIDTESLLIRRVETWTMSPRGTPTYTVDFWSDYRAVDGLRVPFRRETFVDDGESKRVTDFSSFSVR
jgi:hypothetical protein